MHIPDGVLSVPVIAATTALAAGGTALGLRKMDLERVPRAGVLASVFFVASLIHVPIGISSVHLLLGGLAGLLLGWAVFPAFMAALFLQAVLFGHGALTSLGANTCIMALPAVICYYLFSNAIRKSGSLKKIFAFAFSAGALSVVLSCCFCGLALFFTGREFLTAIAAIFIGNAPVIIIEGFITGAAVTLLCQVIPETLGIESRGRLALTEKEANRD